MPASRRPYILWLYPVATTTHSVRRQKQENIRNFLKKGIDFMENLRYNWTVHEQNTQQEV